MENIIFKAALKLIANLKSITIISLTITPLVWLVEKITEWHITNAVYATLVLFAIMADHVLGSIYHFFWAKDFSLKKNFGGLIVKVLVVVLVGYLFEGLNELMAEVGFVRDYTIMSLRLMVFLYPATSAFKLSYEMTNRKFPPIGLMEKLKKYTDLKIDKDETK